MDANSPGGETPLSQGSSPAVGTPQSSNSPGSTEGLSGANASTGKNRSGNPNKPNAGTGNQNSSSSQELFDVKVNGRTVKMTRQEVIDNASMVHAANERFNEAARLRKEHEENQKKYSKNPIQAFLDYTKTLPPEERRKAIEDFYMREYIEPETLTTDQRKLRQLEEWKSQRDAEDAERKAKEQRDQMERLTSKQRDYLQTQIIECMEQSGLPKTKFFVARMAFYMRQNLMNGWQAPLPVIVRQVQNERNNLLQDLAGDDVPAEKLIAAFGDKGEKIINKIRAHDLQKLRESRRTLGGSAQGSSRSPEENSEKISSREVNRRLREMRLGKF